MAQASTLFPYDTLRPIQKELVADVHQALSERKHLICHAPTGLGKTAATISPALSIAKQFDTTVLFLTSRNTQHHIAIETIRAIKDRFIPSLTSSSMLGKRWMCAQGGIDGMSSSEFSDYCRMLRTEGQCSSYRNTRNNNLTLATQAAAVEPLLCALSPMHTSQLVHESVSANLCPYEMGLALSEKSSIIIADYYYAFHPTISEHFLSKINKQLSHIVLIIDEGHNLPQRMRSIFSSSITTHTLSFARKEIERHHLQDIEPIILELSNLLDTMLPPQKEERLLEPSSITEPLSTLGPMSELIQQLEDAADIVRATQKRSSLASISRFLSDWPEMKEGFVRFCRKTKTSDGRTIIGIHHHCIDPSIATGPIIDQTHSTILMSGTLTPTIMYRDILGFSPQRTILKEYPSPFAEENRLALIIPKTTTKYSKRTEGQYIRIAHECANLCNAIPGNVAVFFPSYAVLNSVYPHFSTACSKTQFLEDPRLTTSDRQALLERFKTYQHTGACLLAVASGSFGEGIDLPGNLLRGVVVVGLPLAKPDLETGALISYYDKKFGKGWDYGYTLPAITKTLQNAGRCIRSETDRGVIAFLDERFAYPGYLSCFPSSWNLRIPQDPTGLITAFFCPTRNEQYTATNP